jgi:gamma-glutamyl-gamma-aminobutyrate hydrolase PuuD
MQIFITPNIKKYFKTYIDFLDHYWINFFKKKNLKYIMLNSEINNSLKILKSLKKKNNLLILTGGSDVGKKTYISTRRDNLEKKLIKFALKENIPILGICRGAQLFCKINNFKLIKVKNHMCTKHKVNFNIQFLNYKKTEKVNSYHSYSIKVIKKKNFEIIAQDGDGNVELYSYKKNNLFYMWHPERNKDYKELNRIMKFFYEN